MTLDGTIVDPYNLRIGVLDPSVTINDLYSTFGQFGTISNARVMDGLGHGFVCFVSKDDARNAMMKTDGTFLKGSHVKIRYHEPHTHQLSKSKPKSRQQHRASHRGDSSSSTSSGRPLPPIISLLLFLNSTPLLLESPPERNPCLQPSTLSRSFSMDSTQRRSLSFSKPSDPSRKIEKSSPRCSNSLRSSRR